MGGRKVGALDDGDNVILNPIPFLVMAKIY